LSLSASRNIIIQNGLLGNTKETKQEAMPKPVASTLIWSWEQGIYTLYEQGNLDVPLLLQGDDEPWFMWLTSHTSFSFQGKYGRLNLQKEKRSRGGEGYWYAYRRQGKHTVKKYVGRTPDLSIARLEDLAQLLETPTGETPPAPVPDTVSPSSFLHQMPLLAPKLQMPRLPSSLVERSRLFVRLDAGRMGKLTLLSAPAGFGKTMLVRQWVDNCMEAGNTHAQFPPLAWVTLDPDDNNPVRFWRYLITACQTLQAGLGRSALSVLDTAQQHPFEPFSLEAVLATFLNEFTHASPGGILVLDDYHVITSPQIHKTMAFFLDHLPTTLHLLIITRVDPPFPLTHLRAHHDLCELRAGDLRFSPEETRAFLQQTMPLPLSAEIVTQCETLLEGWVTGLRLLSLLLQGQMTQQEIRRVLETFAGSNQTVVEYFVGEVLEAQPRELQHFLLYTSVLSRLCGPLCDAVTGGNDGEHLLAGLVRANLFLQPLDEPGQVVRWYRYHALFAEAMQHEARYRFGEDALEAVSSRASQWFEQHGMLAEAIEATSQTGDMMHLAELIEHMIGTRHFLEINEFYALRRWLERIPETLLSQRPLLAFNYALALLFASDSDYLVPKTLVRLERMLQMAEESFRREGNLPRLGEIFAFRALIARKRGALREAGTWARQALAWLPAQEPLWQDVSLGIVGEEARHAGQLDMARKTLQEVRAHAQAIGNRMFTRTASALLGEVCVEQGALRLAAEYYRQMLREAREQGDLNDIGHAQVGMAQLFYEWNELAEAERALQEAADIGKLLAHEELQVQAALLQARIESARGQIASAGQRYASLLARMQPHDLPLLTSEVLLWQARLQFALGDFSAVQRWVSSRDRQNAELPLLHQEREEELVARWLLAQEKIDESIDMLLRLLKKAREAGRVHSVLEIQVLLAQAHAARKQRHEAREMLRVTLVQAHAEGYIRLFLDEGDGLIALLQALTLREPPLRAYLQTILHAAISAHREQSLSASPASSVLVTPLSSQEQKVLHLLAAGSSNPEIAQTLVVSVTTVRTQVQSIYRKLGVNNRVAASEMARHLRLL
jgi:LuxR family transcriptional regulator, maltose regulon positive regulatory protein